MVQRAIVLRTKFVLSEQSIQFVPTTAVCCLRISNYSKQIKPPEVLALHQTFPEPIQQNLRMVLLESFGFVLEIETNVV